MSSANINESQSVGLLNRFYGGFTLFCVALLLVGVPFVFVRKLAAALILSINLIGVLVAWQVSRRGNPRDSLIFYSAFMWCEMIAVLYVGLAPNGAALVFAFALMLCAVVSQRAGTVFVVSYLLAWLAYIVLGYYHLAPAPFFPNAPFTGWILVTGASWLILIPIPQLVTAMHAGSALQQSIFEATSDALLVVDRDGQVESYNQKFVDMWHIPADLPAHQEDSHLLHYVLAQLSDPDAFLKRVAEIYAQADLTTSDIVSFKDGRVIKRHSQPKLVDGRMMGRVWSFRDVTESRNAQDELRSSQRKLQGLFDLSPLGMTRNDMNGNYHEMNVAFCQMLGYTMDELKGKSYWQITPRRYAAQDSLQLEKLKSEGVYGPYEKEYIHKAGHEFSVRLNGMLIRDGDGEPSIWSIVEDISAQKVHERILTEATKNAEEASRAKSEFLANMSHEIRTPMNAILGMLQLLGNTQLNSNQFDYLSKSQRAAKSLLSLLNDILDLSKIDAGKMELDIQPFSVDRLLRDLAIVLSANVGSKNIDVVYDIDPKVPAQLVGDSMRLQQILTNLGGNAIKFTASGQVVISMRLISTDGPHDPGQVHIEFAVQDSGIGIASENLDRIFSDFSQAESSTTRRFGGTGLGLAISKQLVELLGSRITLKSELGVGSTFRFGLTLHAGDVLEAPAATHGLQSHVEPIALSAPDSVLIIDDNALSGEAMAKMLRAHVRHVDVASSGQQALAMVRSRAAGKLLPYRCIYVDWQMPEMDGWETVGQLQSLYLEKDIAPSATKLVMLSVNGRHSLSQRTQEEQSLLSAFLVKPATVFMLLEASQDKRSASETVRKAPRSSQRRLAGMRILVVEDNAINQQVAEELLGFEGALVSIAADGRQGVNAVASAKQQFDAVLMDIQMPVMDGFSATRVIRDQLGLTRLPIIGLTANVMASDREACLRAGMDEHMGKPFEIAKLVSLLIKLTGHPPHPTPKIEDAARIQEDEMQATQEVKDSQGSIPDIDVPKALQRLGGMRALYVDAARQFHKILTALVLDLNQLLQAGPLQPALLLLHTAKGNAATLGLERLSAMLRELETLCKTQSDVAQIQLQVQALEPIVQVALGALQQAISQLESQGEGNAA